MKPHCKIGKAATLAATLFVASADRALAANENSVTNYSPTAATERRPTGSFFPKRGEYDLRYDRRTNMTTTPSNPGYGQSFGQWFINEGFAQNPRLNTVGIVSGGLFVAANALYGGAVVLPSVLSNAAAANAAAMARIPVTAQGGAAAAGLTQKAKLFNEIFRRQFPYTIVGKPPVLADIPVAGTSSTPYVQIPGTNIHYWPWSGLKSFDKAQLVESHWKFIAPKAVAAAILPLVAASSQAADAPSPSMAPLGGAARASDPPTPASSNPAQPQQQLIVPNQQPNNQSPNPTANAGSPISADNAQPIGGAGVQREPVKFDPRFDIWNNARGSASLSPSFGGGLGGGPNVFRNDIWGRGSSSGGSGSNAAALALLTMAQETVHSAQKASNACMSNPKTCGGWTPPYTADQLRKQANLATKGAGSDSTITGPGSGSNKIMTPVLQPDGTFKYIDSGSSGRPVSGPAGAKVSAKSAPPSATSTSPAAKSAPASTTSNVRPAAVSGTSRPAPGAGTVAAKPLPSIRNPAPTPNVNTASPQLRTASPQLRVPTPQVRVPTPNVRVPTPQVPVVRVPQVRVNIR